MRIKEGDEIMKNRDTYFEMQPLKRKSDAGDQNPEGVRSAHNDDFTRKAVEEARNPERGKKTDSSSGGKEVIFLLYTTPSTSFPRSEKEASKKRRLRRYKEMPGILYGR